eukprot:7010507-Pyramimonas_sp.AAC.2
MDMHVVHRQRVLLCLRRRSRPPCLGLDSALKCAGSALGQGGLGGFAHPLGSASAANSHRG